MIYPYVADFDFTKEYYHRNQQNPNHGQHPTLQTRCGTTPHYVSHKLPIPTEQMISQVKSRNKKNLNN